jgi:hypothetical protein
MDRRQFLRTSCGMVLAFAAMNSVFGRFFRVEAAELFMPNQAPRADPEFLKAVVGMRDMARRMNPALKEQEARIEDAYLENYIKEIFLDSDTDMVALSALPGTSEETDVLTPEVIIKVVPGSMSSPAHLESSAMDIFLLISGSRTWSTCMPRRKSSRSMRGRDTTAWPGLRANRAGD